MTKPKMKKGDQLTNVDEQSGETQALTEQASNATANNETTALSSVLKALDKSMNDRFTSVESTLSQMQTSLSEINSLISELEGARAEQESRISDLEDIVAANKALHAKLDNLEGRSRRQNIKIMGLQEKVEKWPS